MTLPKSLLEALAKAVERDVTRAALGHCVRIDHLDRNDCEALCRALVERNPGFRAAVLSESDGNGVLISSERAVEIRNRKQTRLCLLVPAEIAESSNSSLGNAFAAYDLEADIRKYVESTLESLPETVRSLAQFAVSAQRGPTRPTIEDVAAYLSIVSASPTLETAGGELSRLSLIPDLGPDVAGRLAANARCARLLARPSRPQMTPGERLTAIGLRPGSLRDELLRYLEGRSLRDWRGWLTGLSIPSRAGLSFHLWSLDTDEPSDLEEIALQPFMAADGSIERWSNLAQPNGPGTEPIVSVGPQARVTVKWKPAPRRPTGLARWRLRLVSAEDERLQAERGAADLPELTLAASRKSGSIPLDIELDSVGVRSVRVEVVGLDEFQAELRDRNGGRVVGLSDEFWLDDRGIAIEPEAITSRRETVPNLPFGRLKVAIELHPEALEEGAGTWAERDLSYYTVTLNGRRASAVATSPILRALEERVLRDPGGLGTYTALIPALDRLDPDWGIEAVSSGSLRGLKSLDAFLARRRDIFRAIRGADDTGLVETTRWTSELTAQVRSYARAYRALIAEAAAAAGTSTAALAVDTMRLSIQTGPVIEGAVVVFPTHPLRLLWYAAYAELLGSWERAVLESGSTAGALLEVRLLERVTPVNVPAFAPHGTDLYPFTGNLRFFWGIATPLNDSGRLAALVAGVLGLPEAEIALADVPPSSVSHELHSYLELHPYVQSLALRVENIGSGEFTAEVLRQLYDTSADEDVDVVPPELPRLFLTAEMQEPVPTELLPLSRLRHELYMARPAGRHSHLRPHFAYSLQAVGEIRALERTPQNVTIVIDGFSPEVEPCAEGDGDSSSFHGLLVRFSPSYASSPEGAVWTHRIDLPRRSNRQPHPVVPALTGELADVHREMLLVQGRLLGGGEGAVPSVVVTVGPDERGEISQTHASSDWVLTLDRFLGPELYDDPSDADMSRVARTYLLDYGPEFLEGIGHRLMVTTSQRAEVVAILMKAMRELGFGLVEQSVGDVLGYLKMISGRLALRIVGNDAHAREAVSLGVVAAYLRTSGQLDNAILVPVDSHPELFGPAARRGKEPRLRCDLLRVRFVGGRMDCSFIEVKSRSAAAHSDELMNRIVDQIEATETVVRDLFFRHDPPRVDRTLQRSRLAAILRFYLARSRRYALVQRDDAYDHLARAIDRLESGIPEMRVDRVGYVVNLTGPSQPPTRLRETTIRFLNAADVAAAGFTPEGTPIPTSADTGDVATRGGQTHGEPIGPDITVALAGPINGGSEEPAPIEVAAANNEELVSQEETEPSWADLDDESATARVELDVPSATIQVGESAPHEPAVRIALGTRVGDGDVVDWSPSVRGSPHLFVLGIPGQGKSWTIARLLDGLLARNVPSIVFDFHGQFARSGGLRRADRLPILRAVEGLPFSPFQTEAGGGAQEGWKTGSFAIAEILQYVCDLGDIQRDLAYQAIRDSYRANGFGQSGGRPVIPTIDEVRLRIEELEIEKGVKNVAARCRPILEFGLFRDGMPDTAFDEIVRSGAVVDVHDLGLETLQLAAGAFLMRRLYKEMFTWGEADHLRLALVLDEAHRLARDVTLPKLMKEGRKFGIVVIVASQGLADFHPDVVGNAGTKAIYRTNFPMSKKVAGYLRASRGVDLAAVIEQLDVGEAYVQTPEMSLAARVRMYPLSETMEG